MFFFFKKSFHRWKELLKEKAFRISLLAGIALLSLAFVINLQSVMYTEDVKVMSVGDLILDNIPMVDLLFLYTWGIFIVLGIVVIYPIFFKPELLPFAAKTIAAFIIIRAGFISLTHLGAPENFFKLPDIYAQPGLFRIFYLNDLFFSGHTGFPFLAALIFWENRLLRWFLILMSLAQGATVLFMHVHYSIDVFSAFFITYSIYIVSDKLFNKLNLSFKAIVNKIEASFH